MSIIFRTASLLALAAASLAPAAAMAQTPWSVSGQLEDGDSRADENRYDDHRIRLEAGQRYRISVDSDAFDPIAHLLRAGEDEPVATNDDAEDGLNARIYYTPPASGDFVLRVTGFAADARGPYTAAVAALPPLPAPVSEPGARVTTQGSWAIWQGELSASDPDLNGQRYDDYLIHVAAGQRRYIAVEAAGFDTLVQVLRAADRGAERVEAVDQDDDTGPGLNSLLGFAPEEAGDYIVRVTSFGEGMGPYRLAISE